MLSAKIIFERSQYNYTTAVNSNLTESEVKKYFVGKTFNLGIFKDNMQKCIDCKITRE